MTTFAFRIETIGIWKSELRSCRGITVHELGTFIPVVKLSTVSQIRLVVTVTHRKHFFLNFYLSTRDGKNKRRCHGMDSDGSWWCLLQVLSILSESSNESKQHLQIFKISMTFNDILSPLLFGISASKKNAVYWKVCWHPESCYVFRL